MKRIDVRAVQGFTLTELAVVFAILTLLIGGLMMPLSAQQDARARQETDRALSDVREALIGYALVNGRLPCPAQANLATGTTGAGLEATTAAVGTTTTVGPCGCTTVGSGKAKAGGAACNDAGPSGVSGVLPWASLGLPETDAWGNRYSYRVTARFGRPATGQTNFGTQTQCSPPTNPTAAAFALCSQGDMTILTATGGTSSLASSIPAVIVSHGKNGLGAYTPQGTQPNPAPAGSDEAENANGNQNFVSNTSIDDQVAWISSSVLMHRMISAGKLP